MTFLFNADERFHLLSNLDFTSLLYRSSEEWMLYLWLWCSSLPVSTSSRWITSFALVWITPWEPYLAACSGLSALPSPPLTTGQGLVKALDFLEANSVQLGTLVTDRHKQIARYMREARPDITHQNDVWHISKSDILLITYTSMIASESCKVVSTGIKKKLARLSTQ